MCRGIGLVERHLVESDRGEKSFDRRLFSFSAGDSGGPLMYQENGGSWTIGGITSYGYGCSKRGFPGVYVRTAAYASWIKQKMLAG